MVEQTTGEFDGEFGEVGEERSENEALSRD